MDCVIAVIVIKLAAVIVTPLRKYLTWVILRKDFHNGNIKNTNKVPGIKILNPPNKPAKKEYPVPAKDLEDTNAAKLNSGPGMAWSIA